MIERDILFYLQSSVTLTSLLGGVSKIFPILVPDQVDDAKVLMPWLVIEPAGGTRKKINATTMQERTTVRISVDADAGYLATSRDAVETAHLLLENYRGVLTTARDVVITCSPIRGWAGYSAGTYRWQFDAIVEFLEDYVEPLPYTASS